MAIWEEEFIYIATNPYISSIKYWRRFLDDTLILWDGPEEEFYTFLDYLNINPINIQFTVEFGGNHLNSLDVTISINGKSLQTCGYRKKTATNSLLHYDNCHPLYVKKSVPFGQFIRLRRINSDYNVFLSQAKELMDSLRA